MANESFLIAGGGIAGLAAALAVAGTGRTATILEQAPVFEEVGAGLQLGPNAVKSLKLLGAWEAIAPWTFTPQRLVIRDGHSGVTLLDVDLGGLFEQRFGEPYRVIHRADLLAGLLSFARASREIILRPGKRLTGFTELAGTVVTETVSGESFSGEALIGADGIRSVIRENLVGGEPAYFAGQVLFRALVPLSEMPVDFDVSAVTLWLCRRAHVVHYPVSAGRSLNIVAAANGFWTDEGWSSHAEPDEVAPSFAGCDSRLVAALAMPTGWTKWAGVRRQPAPFWSKGRITLIGDAAHPMLPYLAQGAAMALEDAAVLSGILSAESDIPAAFSAYEEQRLARTNRVVRSSRRQAWIYHASGLLRLVRNAYFRRLGADAFLSRMAWLYGWEPPPR
jgi:2-polyprenyl-6-methoxyphenol hydroxylase-like FAD-dependent oxidoreductase